MEAEIERIGILRNPVVSWQEAHGEPAPPRVELVTRARESVPPPKGRGCCPPPSAERLAVRSARVCAGGVTTACRSRRELAAGRDEARPRPRADGRGGARRAGRARARQRPLPDELLGDEGLRRGRLPARGRPGADRLEASRTTPGARAWTQDVRFFARLRPTRPAPAARSRARACAGRPRARLRPRRPRALPRDAGVRPDGRRADDVHARLVPRVRAAGRRRDAAARTRARDQDGAGARAACGSRTRSRPRRWSTSRRGSAGDEGGRGGARCGTASSTARAPAGKGRSSSRSASRWSGQGRASRPSPRPATGR